MNHKIQYDDPTYFLGREGRVATYGLQIADGGDTTLLTPLTREGEAGRASIEIPNDRAREIAYTLLEIARGYESQAAKEKGVEPKPYDDNPYDHHSSYDGCCQDCPACGWEAENRCDEYEDS